jgi:hypothetical protein
MLSRLCLYFGFGGGLNGRHESLTRVSACPPLNRVLLLVDFELLGTSRPLTPSPAGGEILRFLRGPRESRSISSSSLLVDDTLAESEFVTAWTPFFTIRLLELCELGNEENDVFAILRDSDAGIWDRAGIEGPDRLTGEGISTASRIRDLVDVDIKEDLTEVRPELSGGTSCISSIPPVCFLDDLRVDVECPDLSGSSPGVSSRPSLGEVEHPLRGRPRPRFTVLVSSRCCSCGDTGTRRFAGDNVLSRVFAPDGFEETTIISSSSLCRGM